MEMENHEDNVLDIFEGPKTNNCLIKVIGVGGGGGNAVNHMYREGIHDVSFVVCNTDAQALNDSPLPVRLQLGTEGLGAGNRPEKARKAAEESIEDIKKMLSDGTRMTFITAGMGGGTGTGAAPVVARVSKEMGILTIGIVTIPFKFEGKSKIYQALDGVHEISKNVDALLVINNERLRRIHRDLQIFDAFAKADDTLNVAVKSIAEIITKRGKINLDFNDVSTILKDGGVAIMSTGFGEGEHRVENAIKNALDSPLLNDNDIYNSQKILFNISFSEKTDGEYKGMLMGEMDEVHAFMDKFKSCNIETIWGLSTDDSLGNKIKITILATGFGLDNIDRLRGQDINTSKSETISPEEMQKLKDLMNRYYGDGEEALNSHPNVYLFDDEDLDNDYIISDVENIPTYKRTHNELNAIKIKAAKEEKEEEIKIEETEEQKTIKF